METNDPDICYLTRPDICPVYRKIRDTRTRTRTKIHANTRELNEKPGERCVGLYPRNDLEQRYYAEEHSFLTKGNV